MMVYFYRLNIYLQKWISINNSPREPDVSYASPHADQGGAKQQHKVSNNIGRPWTSRRKKKH